MRIASLLTLILLLGGAPVVAAEAQQPKAAKAAAEKTEKSDEAVADRTEGAPSFRASKVLKGVPLKGANYSVRDTVTNDGLMNTYTVDTTFGSFRFTGTETTKERLREIAAIAALQQVSRGDQFAKGLTGAVTAPIRLAGGLVTDPGQTVTGVVGGVGSRVTELGHSLFGPRAEGENGPVRTLVGVTTVERELAAKMGVDPYSSFKPLRDELRDVARPMVAGNLTVTAVLAVVPGGILIGAPKAAQGAYEQVSRTTVPDLNQANWAKLRAMGVEQSANRIFQNNEAFSPTQKVLLVNALDEMRGVADRSIVIERASLVRDDDDADFQVRMAQMLAGYNRRVDECSRVVMLGKYPGVQSKKGAAVLCLPVDYLAWTDEIAAMADGSGANDAKALEGVKSIEVWVEGGVSALAKKNLESRGLKVFEQTGAKLGLE